MIRSFLQVAIQNIPQLNGDRLFCYRMLWKFKKSAAMECRSLDIFSLTIVSTNIRKYWQICHIKINLIKYRNIYCVKLNDGFRLNLTKLINLLSNSRARECYNVSSSKWLHFIKQDTIANVNKTEFIWNYSESALTAEKIMLKIIFFLF